MKHFLFLLTFSLVSMLLVFQTGNAAITIRSSSCIGGEVCLFSMWNKTDPASHTGECGYYGEVVCSDEVSSASIKSSCSSGENSLLSFLPVNISVNNSHVGTRLEHTFNLCIIPPAYTCAVRNSCLGGQSCMGSISNETNAHFAECNFYSKQVCCGNDTTVPTISNHNINTTAILPNSTVRFNVTVTDNFEVSKVIATVQYPNGTQKNFTMSVLSNDIYFFDFTDTSNNGVYTWVKTYANDSLNNFATSSPNLEFRTLGITYIITGTALDYLTGKLMTTGNATAIIKETGDRGNGTISNGKYSVNIQTNLNVTETKFTVGIILESGGKIGYNELITGVGQFTKQIQKCSIKQWRFTGWAVDSEGARISSGNVSVSVNNGTLIRNTTAFTNGRWDIVFSPCLISGQTYDFQILLTSADKRVYTFIRQVAK